MALKTVTREFEGFLEDRKSRFLAHLVPVDMFDQRMEELRKEIEDLKKNNPATDLKRAVDESIAPVSEELRKETSEIDKSLKEAQTADEPAKS